MTGALSWTLLARAYTGAGFGGRCGKGREELARKGEGGGIEKRGKLGNGR